MPDLIALLDDPDPNVLTEVAEGLGPYCERAATAVPALVRLLDHPNDWLLYHVVNTLTAIGPAAAMALPQVQRLVNRGSISLCSSAEQFVRTFADRAVTDEQIRQGLRSKKAEERARSVEQLARLTPPLPDAVELLQRALSDRSKAVRGAVGQVLRRMAWPEGADPTPLLRQALAAREEEIRQSAVEQLRLRPDHGLSLLPECLGLLEKDPSAGVRNCVVELLGHQSSPTPEMVRAVCSTLRDPDEYLPRQAITTLRRWQPLPAEVLPDLLELARTGQVATAGDILELLLQQSQFPADLLPVLLQRLHRYPESWEHQAFLGLVQLGYVPGVEELPLLVRGLEEDNTSFAYGAAELLARLGSLALPELIRHLNAGFPEQTRRCAAHALGQIGPPAAAALPHLAPLLNEEEIYLRTTVIEAIGRIAPPAEVIHLLRPYLRDRQGRVRSDILKVVVGLGADALPLLPDLLYLVRTEDSDRDNLSLALAGLAAHSEEVVARLREVLHEPESLTRNNALAALARLGPRAAAALPDVQNLLDQTPAKERWLLEHTLKKIQEGG